MKELRSGEAPRGKLPKTRTGQGLRLLKRSVHLQPTVLIPGLSSLCICLLPILRPLGVIRLCPYAVFPAPLHASCLTAIDRIQLEAAVRKLSSHSRPCSAVNALTAVLEGKVETPRQCAQTAGSSAIAALNMPEKFVYLTRAQRWRKPRLRLQSL